MKTYWGGDIMQRILALGTRRGWEVSFMPQPLYPWGKSLQYPLDRRLGGPQSWSGQSGEEKHSQSPLRIKPPNPDHPACSQLLFWLSYPSSSKFYIKLFNYFQHTTSAANKQD